MPQFIIFIIILIFFSPSLVQYLRENNPEVLSSFPLLASVVTPDVFVREQSGILKVSGFFEKEVVNTSQNPIRDITDFVFDPSVPQGLFVGTKSGTLYYKTGPSPWFVISGSKQFISQGFSIRDIFIGDEDPTMFYTLAVSSGKESIFVSKDRGEHFEEMYSVPQGSRIQSVVRDPSHEGVIFVALANGLIVKSADFGVSWSKHSFIKEGIISMTVSPASPATFFIVLTPQGTALISRDKGALFTSLLVPVPIAITKEERFQRFAFDPHNSLRFFYFTGTKLYETKDGGFHFKEIEFPVDNPSLVVSSVALSPHNKEVIYLALQHMLLKSIDGGVSWSVGMFDVSSILDIQFDPKNEDMVYLKVVY